MRIGVDYQCILIEKVYVRKRWDQNPNLPLSRKPQIGQIPSILRPSRTNFPLDLGSETARVPSVLGQERGKIPLNLRIGVDYQCVLIERVYVRKSWDQYSNMPSSRKPQNGKVPSILRPSRTNFPLDLGSETARVPSVLGQERGKIPLNLRIGVDYQCVLIERVYVRKSWDQYSNMPSSRKPQNGKVPSILRPNRTNFPLDLGSEMAKVPSVLRPK